MLDTIRRSLAPRLAWLVPPVAVSLGTVAALVPVALRARDAEPAISTPYGAVVRDIAYVRGGSAAQKLDLYLPEGDVEGPDARPLVLWIHGGSFAFGDRTMLSAQTRTGFPLLRDRLLRAGYAVASVDYRLRDEARYPAAVHDVKAAVRFLRADADRWGVDADRIGVIGESAGGYLAQMLGTTGDRREFDGPPGTAPGDPSVRSVVSYYGVSDLRTKSTVTRCPDASNPTTSEGGFLGVEPRTAAGREPARRASPVTYVSRGDAPFLLLHGTADCNSPPEQSITMDAALRRAGVPSRLVLLDGADHADPRFYRTTVIEDGVLAFLDRTLAPRTTPADRPPPNGR